VFGTEHAAPGLAEQRVIFFNAQMAQQIIQFRQKERGLPEAGGFLGKVRRAAITNLIVMDHRAAGSGDIAEGINVIMGAAGAAVSNNQRSFAVM